MKNQTQTVATQKQTSCKILTELLILVISGSRVGISSEFFALMAWVLILILGPTGWKERTYPHKLPSGLPTLEYYTLLLSMHPPHAYTQIKEIFKNLNELFNEVLHSPLFYLFYYQVTIYHLFKYMHSPLQRKQLEKQQNTKKKPNTFQESIKFQSMNSCPIGIKDFILYWQKYVDFIGPSFDW